MAMMEQHVASSYFQTTHSRVDSKLHSDLSSEKAIDDFSYTLAKPVSPGGLRRCAATRDLTSIGSNVNYCAKVSVDYMLGDASTPFHAPSWKLLAPNGKSNEIVVDNLETVRRFKKSLYMQLCSVVSEEGIQCVSEDTWSELYLFRKQTDGSGAVTRYEPIEGDQEALYMFALKDGDQIVLLIHENYEYGRSGSEVDSVARWVETIQQQTEFEAVDA
ncbi:hypothetical protein BX616_006605 [Lobosporangium transversale]|uniref:Uncharacterized protein n=1 Tax=Lobosporangium transversale TaxID=64571 RepID=A0A1Y2GV76_9FUNG|nr:hypothetical protein BCR41DRAFT_384763 [Lobosporangium transversale]KAF9896872.1 hypothetical protein BX616_006605 [Lobosporangium transversale]ORZ24964.1 hypothetical protein BCR41DRAFT_384763 [Lobosporangium transversale]|eukprot:XP_021883945.1 hypothetical protein BCR41DRAFT_384763 [Lobosporangium transversale]